MAVENKYTNADLAAAKPADPAFSSGAESFGMITRVQVAVADSDGSIFRVLKDLSGNLIPKRILILNDAITDGTDYDLGLYEPLLDGVQGAVIDKDVFVDGLDMSSARARGSEADGLSNVGIELSQRKIFEHAGDTLSTQRLGYDIAWTANTVGSAVGDIITYFEFLQGN